MAENRSVKRVLCPFGEECLQSRECRAGVAKIVADRRIILSNDLKRELKEGDPGCGEDAARKALKFLHHVEKDEKGEKKDIFGCRRHIEALCKVKERRSIDKSSVICFNGQNKLD